MQWGYSILSKNNAFNLISFPMTLNTVFTVTTSSTYTNQLSFWNPQYNKSPLVANLTTNGFSTTLPSDTYRCDCFYIVIGF